MVTLALHNTFHASYGTLFLLTCVQFIHVTVHSHIHIHRFKSALLPLTIMFMLLELPRFAFSHSLSSLVSTQVM